MLWINYLKVALRNLLRRKAFSAITIFGLALGLACCLIVVLFVHQELSYDRFHAKADRIVRIREDLLQESGIFESVRSQSWLGPALLQDFPEVKGQSRLFRGGGVVSRGDLRNDETLFFADASFLTVFTFPLLSGDPASALAEPASAVITRRLAEKYFGKENAVGKILTVNGKFQFKITGLLADIPKESHIKFDFLGSFDYTRNLYGEERYRDGRIPSYTYLLLDRPESVGPLEEKIGPYLKRKKGDKYAAGRHLILQPLTSIHLQSHVRLELENNSRVSSSYLLSVVALIVLLIACANYVNLSTAGAISRFREIGIRKVIGADRRRLFRQFMGEALILAGLSAIPAIGLAQMILPIFNTLTGRTLDWGEMRPLLWLGFAGFVLLIGAAAGAYPASVLAAGRPVQALKGLRDRQRMSTVVIRKGLVVFQFVLASAFIIGTLFMTRQIDFIRKKDLGFDRERVVVLPLPPTGKTGDYRSFKAELLRIPDVQGVTAAMDIPGRHPGLGISYARPDAEGNPIPMNFTSVDEDFFRFFGMKITAGRSFDPSSSSDIGDALILNETAAKVIGENEVLGMAFRDQMGEVSGTVIGIVKDFHNVPLHEDIRPAVYQIKTGMFGAMMVRITPGRTAAVLAALKAKWMEWDPYQLFFSSFLDDALDAQYREDRRIGHVFTFAAVLTVVIACLGMIGLSIFLVQQKVKEIGIRKVLGASSAGIVALLCRGLGGPVLLSNLLAWPIAYGAYDRWQANFAYRASFSPWPFILGAGLILAVSLAVVSIQTVKAALANPVEVLKYE